MNYDQTLVHFFDSPKKRLIATISVVVITVLLVTTTWFLIVCKEERKNLEEQVKGLKAQPLKISQTLPVTPAPICTPFSEEVKTAIAEVCPKPAPKVKKVAPKREPVLKPLQPTTIVPVEKPEAVIVPGAREGGCIYTSDGTMVLKDGTKVSKGVEVARIHDKILVKKYPFAFDSDEAHKKACHLWSKETAVAIQKSSLYVNNDTHRVKE